MDTRSITLTKIIACTGLALGLTACGGGAGYGGGTAAAPTGYTIGGTVSGLTGTGLVLQNNGADNNTIAANGSFTFATMLPYTATYSVTVLTQPSGQTCTVANGSGIVGFANVTNVTVTCA